jgi:UDP-N-acetyl-D-mannosaminuronate dehydrogenase
MHDLLNELGLSMKGTTVGVMGLSYKANVDDLRESPAIKIIEELEKKKARIIRFDPFIPEMSDAKNTTDFLKKSDSIIFVTNHKVFLDLDPKIFKKFGIRAIVDGVNCLDKEKIKKLGIKYRGIGRG